MRAALSLADQDQQQFLASVASRLDRCPPEIALAEYRKADKTSQDEGECRREQIARNFMAEYVNVFLIAGNEAADVAASVGTYVREAWISELSAVGRDLPVFATDGVVYDQEARCWGLAEDAERRLNSSHSRPEPSALAIKCVDLPRAAELGVYRIRAKARKMIFQIKETRRGYLRWVARNYGVEQYREACAESDQEKESELQNLAGKFVTEYVSLVISAGNDPEALAKAQQTEVRQACLEELNTLGLELPASVMDRVLNEQEAHCWGLAEAKQLAVLSSETTTNDKPKSEESTSAFRAFEQGQGQEQSSGSEVPLGFEGGVTTGSSPETHRLFRKSGDVWELAFAGKTVHVRHSKGMDYIAHLLRSPDCEVHSTPLFLAIAGELHTPVLASAGEVLDPAALKQYKSRMEDLEYQLDQAERNNDQGNKEAAQAELDQLQEQVSSAVGLGGRPRHAHDDADKIRKSVRIAIERAIKSIRKHHPALAEYLKVRIQCGTFLRYQGDGIDWQF
jgi:hypothetical protein